MLNHSTKCSICSQTQDYCEILNIYSPEAPNEPVGGPAQVYPEIYKKLICPNVRLESFYACARERLLKCPECKSYFIYCQWTPGGSDDVFKSYEYESYQKISLLVAHA